MDRRQAADFDQKMLDLYDDYARGEISKREFFDQAAKFAIGSMTATVENPIPNDALAQQVAPDDPSIDDVERIICDSPNGLGSTTDGFHVKPVDAADTIARSHRRASEPGPEPDRDVAVNHGQRTARPLPRMGDDRSLFLPSCRYIA